MKNILETQKEKLSLKGILKKVIWATHFSDSTEIKERAVRSARSSVAEPTELGA